MVVLLFVPTDREKPIDTVAVGPFPSRAEAGRYPVTVEFPHRREIVELTPVKNWHRVGSRGD